MKGRLLERAGRLLLLVLVTACLWACAEKKELAFVTNNPSNFWNIARKGILKAEKEFNVRVEFRIPAKGTAGEQQEIIEDLITKGIKGMAISPVDPANQTPLLNKASESMYVICHDSDAPESKRLCYVGTENYKAGREAGKLIEEVLPQGGTVMLFVGTLDAQNARDRRQGILDELEGTKCRVLGSRTDNTDRARAKANVEETLIKYPDIDCLVGLWSYNGPTIAGVVRETGKKGKVKVVCFDEEEVTLQSIKDGIIYATAVQKPFMFGYESVRILAGLLQGDRSVLPQGQIYDTGVTVVRKENVDAFWAELKELLK